MNNPNIKEKYALFCVLFIGALLFFLPHADAAALATGERTSGVVSTTSARSTSALVGEAAAPLEGTFVQGETSSSALDVGDTNASDPAEGPSEMEINQYFAEILGASDFTPNPVGTLLRRLPRYGMSFFRQSPSTYAPVDSVPVTAGYLLGPEDELVITLWGMVEGNFNVTINRDGFANVPNIGSVRLLGYTLEEAKRVLKAAFDRYFTDYQMNVSMGGLRSVTVYVTGDVRRPGAYTISSFATLVNALLASGGPSNSGTLRCIELKRGGKTITTFDMYDLLLKGDKTKDVRLLPEDVIFVPPTGPLVGLTGEIRRPGVYELKTKTRVQDLLYLAGGISAQTFKGRIQYYKIGDQSYRTVFEGGVQELSGTLLSDGDILRLFPVINLSTIVKIGGPVGRPGTYGVVPGVTKISELISYAGGLLITASNRAELTRITPTPSGPVTSRFEIDVSAALSEDPAHNLTLEVDDYLLVHIIPDWESQRMVNIRGEVLHPGTYAVIKGERLSDLLLRSGGFTSRAYLRGGVFTRRRVAEEQRKELNRTADQMERDLLEVSGQQTTNSASAARAEEYQRRRELIESLRNVPALGRVVIKLDVSEAIKGTPWDLELEDGDQLQIPQVPSTVEIMGAVYAASSQVYNSRMGINDYINAAGGYLRTAHKRMLYLMKADGTIVRLTRGAGVLSSKKWMPPKGLSAMVEPGDTIVAPVKYSDRQSFESLRDTIDIIYKVAVAVGVIIR
ncbi:MAG: SLBB domain-containing protein [Synergistaceae bacterium]|nr:SLBB domain-containing protein [Synergistaceae bacterium]